MYVSGSQNTPIAMGDVFAGKYRVDAKLGAGGMGVVLGATELGGGVRVAIKLLNAEAGANGELVARFLREAEATSRLRSKNVARVLDCGTTEQGQPYVVTERLDVVSRGTGRSATRRWRSSRRPWPPMVWAVRR